MYFWLEVYILNKFDITILKYKIAIIHFCNIFMFKRKLYPLELEINIHSINP